MKNFTTKFLVITIIGFATVFSSNLVQAQNLTKIDQKENFDIYKVDNQNLYGDILNADIPKTSALRKYILQEVKKNNNVIDINYSKENGFFIQAAKSVDALSLDEIVSNSVNSVNATLINLINNGIVGYDLSNYIKSNLIEY